MISRLVSQAAPRALFLGILAAAFGAIAGASAQDLPAAASDDEAAIRSGAEAYEKAYDAGDAKALAAMFTADAEVTEATGRTLKGRDAIEAEYAAIFARQPGAKIEVSIDSIKFLSPDVALESGTAQASSPSAAAAPAVKYNAIHVKRDGLWLINNLNETGGSAAGDKDHLAALEFLIGNWQAHVGPGKTYELECDWVPGNKFIKRRFSIVAEGKPVSGGVQIIGYDPILGQVVSWTFDSTGGFGHEIWEREDGRWRIQASSTLADGSTALSTNFLTQGNNDSFTWQSVDRSLNDQLLPDTALVRVKRVSR